MATKNSAVNITKDVVVNLGTKKENVVFEYNDRFISDFFPNHCKDKLIIAKDDIGFYLTGKSYVDANLLDPYRQYNRIVPVKNEDNSFTLPTSF